jgi:hypothetical protein
MAWMDPLTGNLLDLLLESREHPIPLPWPGFSRTDIRPGPHFACPSPPPRWVPFPRQRVDALITGRLKSGCPGSQRPALSRPLLSTVTSACRIGPQMGWFRV